jgi:hypothetical protein
VKFFHPEIQQQARKSSADFQILTFFRELDLIQHDLENQVQAPVMKYRAYFSKSTPRNGQQTLLRTNRRPLRTKTADLVENHQKTLRTKRADLVENHQKTLRTKTADLDDNHQKT